jgi:hypothetical protein
MNPNWFRVRGSSSPFGYRTYGVQTVGDPTVMANQACSADTMYAVPWFTGPGGNIDAFHISPVTVGNSVGVKFALYGSAHAWTPRPVGRLFVGSYQQTTGTTSVAMVVADVHPNAMLWLVWQCSTRATMERPENTVTMPLLGTDPTSAMNAFYGLQCSYAFASGPPIIFPLSGEEVIGTGTPRPPWLAIHYAD